MTPARAAAFLAATLLAATPALAMRPSDPDVGSTVGAGDILGNEHTLDVHGATARAASANCQLVVAAGLLVAADAQAAAEARTVDRTGGNLSDVVPGLDVIVRGAQVFDNATASCRRDVGSVRIEVSDASAWTREPPFADGATQGAWWSPKTNLTVNATGALGDVAANVAVLRLDGPEGTAAASCQLLIAVDVVIVAAALASVEQTNATAAPVAAQQPGGSPGVGNASCRQHVGAASVLVEL